MVCENRMIEACKFVNDNLENLVNKLTFFLDNFLSLETIAFFGTGILIAMSLVFCICTSILAIRSLNRYLKAQPASHQSYRK
jgi:hypothetical protein